jgi:hypothetical protein
MDQEQYDTERWMRVESYTVAHPHFPGCTQQPRKVEIWEAGSASDLVEYGQRVHARRVDRRAAYRTRMEAEDDFRKEVDEMVDHDTPYRPRREG